MQLTLTTAKTKLSEAYQKYLFNYVLYIRSMEIINYVYDKGGCFDRVFPSSGAIMILEWSTRNDYSQKCLTLSVMQNGCFHVYLYSHTLDGLNFEKDAQFDNDSCIKTLKEGIEYMLT